jgi:membrane-bound ClpP family serine protease
MELYKTFGFALTPFVVLFVVGMYFYRLSETTGINAMELQNSHAFVLVFLIAGFMLFMGVALEWWVHKFYGKYAKEIRKVIDELKE